MSEQTSVSRLPKMVATDLDGTIVRSDGTISTRTVQALLADARLLQSTHAACDSKRIVVRLNDLGVRSLSFSDWRRLDALEIEAGKAAGKVREKFVSIEAMLEALNP